MTYKFETGENSLEISNTKGGLQFNMYRTEEPSYSGDRVELDRQQLFELIGGLLSIQSKLKK